MVRQRRGVASHPSLSLCLLGANVIAHSAVLTAVDKFVRMREITRSVKDNLNVLLQSFCLLTRHVTLTFGLLTLNRCHTCRIT